ncbi:hypothetical protein AGOR_G00035610 [Albula goreensis]|uniref:Uncharacterized protein n=1 Tax=Albula goreensis TaxID=1534307 RepID=A0A8T3E0M3_9TELE|nr:hypothetical protein AGOR_G00035610 [Albula goreensis]
MSLDTEMSKKLFFLSSLVILLIALLAAAAGQGDGDTTSAGVMDKAEEVYRTVLEKVQQAGGAVKGFAANSYEEHLEPAVSWATEAAASAWDKVKTKLSDFFAD